MTGPIRALRGSILCEKKIGQRRASAITTMPVAATQATVRASAEFATITTPGVQITTAP